ncbi:MAG TPA: DUF2911 domain-containing protein [Flavobacteriales bacterium]|jgi:hypothetical protein|nr:DUF2911 domain-containing protein [Flavobacteriales bacterium]
MTTRLLTYLVAASLSLTTLAQDLPSTSPSATVEQTIGVTKIKVNYSRPSAKGRTIFGGLVPFGKVWRTGANKATRIELSGPVVIDGKELPAGAYALLTIPEQGQWKVLFNRDPELSAAKYKEGNDALIVSVPAKDGEFAETFTISFCDLSVDAGSLELRWATTVIRVPMKADATAQGLANIDQKLQDKEIDYAAYNRMARFCLDRGERAKESLEWAKRSVELESHYWNVYTLALAWDANGKREDAVQNAVTALDQATKEGDSSTADQIMAKLKEWGVK